MLYVDRSSVQLPPQILARLRRETNKLIEFQKAHLQRRHQFNMSVLKGLKPQLRELFHDKCAFCESPVNAVSHGDIENFRPKSIYWWLTYEWNNLYFACQICNSTKRDIFPLADETSRATNYLDDLYREKSLLLDPCIDNPAQHFRYEIDEALQAVRIQSRTLQS